MKTPVIYLFFLSLFSNSFSQVSLQPLRSSKPEIIVFKTELKDYQRVLNVTRKSAGVAELQEKKALDDYCMERCMRMVEMFASNTEKTHTDFPRVFSVEGHNGAKISENTVYLRESLPDLKPDQLTLLNPQTALKWVSTGVTEKYVLSDKLNQKYNNSPGHLKNRTQSVASKYGECTIAVFYVVKNPKFAPGNGQPEEMVYKLILNYEAFEQ
jgi:uncharacterized protein YkwD